MAREISSDLVGVEFDPVDVEWNSKDTILYALGIGSKPEEELDFVYEAKGPKVIPSFGVIPGMTAMSGLIQNVKFDLVMLLHGEQAVTQHRPIPSDLKAKGVGRITEVWDKGKGAVVGVECEISDNDGPVITSKSTLFIRGAGGFGGERGPSTKGLNAPPDRDPDHVVEEVTLPQQAAIYRLSGDRNPIHIDPDFAKMGGFDKPFLHGLCSFGFGCRASMKALCDNQPEKFKSMEGRFADQVWMEDTLITKIWVVGDGEAVIQMETQKGNAVLTQAKVTYEA